jgi:hypothetical protein
MPWLSDCSGSVPLADITHYGSVESGKEHKMKNALLLQSVLGHLALLEQKYPKKAASPVARRAKRYIERLRRSH